MQEVEKRDAIPPHPDGCGILADFNEVKRILGIPERLKIAYACRLGYLTSPVRQLRVRRDIEDFTHYNRFGNKAI